MVHIPHLTLFMTPIIVSTSIRLGLFRFVGGRGAGGVWPIDLERQTDSKSVVHIPHLTLFMTPIIVPTSTCLGLFWFVGERGGGDMTHRFETSNRFWISSPYSPLNLIHDASHHVYVNLLTQNKIGEAMLNQWAIFNQFCSSFKLKKRKKIVSCTTVI